MLRAELIVSALPNLLGEGGFLTTTVFPDRRCGFQPSQPGDPLAGMAEDEGLDEGSLVSQAELTLQHLLQKQLATSGRLERVDFRLAGDSMQCIGHSISGLASHEHFCQLETKKDQEAADGHAVGQLLQFRGLSESQIKDHFRKSSHDLEFISDHRKRVKQRRYGVHPDFSRSLEPSDISVPSVRSEEDNSFNCMESSSRHEIQLEATVMQGKDRIRRIAHLSAKDIISREPLLKKTRQNELNSNTTLQDRVSAAQHTLCRTAAEVFLSPAPPVLDLHTYLQMHVKEQHSAASADVACDTLNDQSAESKKLLLSDDIAQQATPKTSNLDAQVDFQDVPMSSILENRLGVDEIKQLDGGRFSNYAPGEPSGTLYIKNLSPAAMEQDLVAIFIRYQRPGKQLFFRLMHSGRMKGQAFITFPDVETATDALQLVNGFKLKDRPMIIEFGRQRTSTPRGLME